MSDIGLGFGSDDEGTGHGTPQPEPAPVRLPQAGSRRAPKPAGRRLGGCLPILLVLVVVAAGAWFGGSWVVDKVQSFVGGAPDYSSTSTKPGADAVLIEVRSGDNAAAIGRTLKAAGVVKSVDAFVDAATADDRSRGIQVGFYRLNKELKASAALSVLVNPDNLIKTTVTIPEGARLSSIPKLIASKTDFTEKQVKAAMSKPAALGLPAEADGNLEGYLFPATYNVLPGATAKSLLTQMVDKAKAVEKELGVATKAAALGLTPHQVITVASILEYEANRDEDYAKVARVLYNRIQAGMALQLDSTVAYAYNITGRVTTTDAERNDASSPYNTYQHQGLPPGPIGSPGAKTIEAALNPASGDWLYFVLVDLDTGETRFNDSFAGHQQDVQAFRSWCQANPGRC